MALGIGATVRRVIRRHRFLASCVFRQRFLALQDPEYYFDSVTLPLCQVALRYARGARRILDLGTGSSAVIGLYLQRRTPAEVVSADVNPELLAHAAQTIVLNGARITTVQSSFFESTGGDFDLVVFNPPFVPAAQAAELQLSSGNRSQWDGGGDGMSIIKQFLPHLHRLKRGAHICMGVNARLIPRQQVLAAVAGTRQLEIVAVTRSRIFGADVYVLRTLNGQ